MIKNISYFFIPRNVCINFYSIDHTISGDNSDISIAKIAWAFVLYIKTNGRKIGYNIDTQMRLHFLLVLIVVCKQTEY